MDRNDKYEQLSQWISDMLDNKISDEDFQKMQNKLHSDPAYMRYYIEYVSICALMEKRSLEGSLRKAVKSDAGQHNSLEDTSEIILKLVAEEEEAESVIRYDIDGTQRKPDKRETSLNSLKLQNILFKIAAIILICFGILQLDDIIVNYKPEDPLPKLARVSKHLNSDLRYKGVQQVTDNWLWPGDYHLREGYMSLKYHSGAEVVLEAPAVFRLESFDTIYLSYGKLFANVPPLAKGFTINTDNAKVMDLGTEFGVDVSVQGDTDLYVYKGKTALVCNTIDTFDSTQMVTAGNARGVKFGGNEVNDIELENSLFVRSINSDEGTLWRGDNICLADIVGGGNGFGTGAVEVGINPLTGERGPYSIFDRDSDGRYVKMTRDRYIDGVFVPSGNGQVISSKKHVFDNCPATNNVFYADIISGSGVNSVFGSKDELMILDGIKYGSKNNPGLSIHANLGITFDLDKIRADLQNYDISISRLTAKIGISDICPNNPHAVFWVLVDGRLCYYKELTERGLASSIDIAINDSDRFLTIVSTDGGDVDIADKRSSNSDWCVLANPKLELELR